MFLKECFDILFQIWPQFVSEGSSEWVIKINGLFETADIKVHIVDISHVIIALVKVMA